MVSTGDDGVFLGDGGYAKGVQQQGGEKVRRGGGGIADDDGRDDGSRNVSSNGYDKNRDGIPDSSSNGVDTEPYIGIISGIYARVPKSSSPSSTAPLLHHSSLNTTNISHRDIFITARWYYRSTDIPPVSIVPIGIGRDLLFRYKDWGKMTAKERESERERGREAEGRERDRDRDRDRETKRGDVRIGINEQEMREESLKVRTRFRAKK